MRIQVSCFTRRLDPDPDPDKIQPDNSKKKTESIREDNRKEKLLTPYAGAHRKEEMFRLFIFTLL